MDDRTAHVFIVENGLRQLEWDHGGQFSDPNSVVDRHNREIIAAYKKGLDDACKSIKKFFGR